MVAPRPSKKGDRTSKRPPANSKSRHRPPQSPATSIASSGRRAPRATTSSSPLRTAIRPTDITPAPLGILFTGTGYFPSTSVGLQATVSGACKAGQTVTFVLDANANGNFDDDTPLGTAVTNSAGVATLTTSIAGEHCNSVTVATPEGLTGESRACTVWRGYAGLLLEMIDTVDPIQVGEMTDYVITITNQGTADDTNITTVNNN